MSRLEIKFKQVLTKLLALAMLLAMAPVLPGGLAYADDITYTNSSADHQGTEDVGGFGNNWGVTISTDKSEYSLGEDIYVKIEGSAEAGEGAWIGLFDNYNASNQSYYWAYVNSDFSGKVINNVESTDKIDGLEFQHEITSGTYYVILMNNGRWAITPLTIGDSSTTEDTITTDKDTYAIDEPIMVTATSSVPGVWVSLLGKNDAVDAQSYYWYYVSEHNGEAFNIYEGTPSREADITDGEYKLVIIEDTAEGYKALAQKDVFIGTYVEPSITLNKEGSFPEYKYGEQVLLTAQGSDASAWVGVYDYDPVFPDGSYARFYIKDITGSVDLVEMASEAGKPLNYGESYRIYLCINEEGNPNSIQFNKSLKFKLLETYGDPTWEWDEDFTTATATFKAKHDSTVTKTVEVTGDGITSEVTKEATEEEEGIKNHTATITADMIDFTTENDPPFIDTKTEVIPKLTHVHTCELVPAKEPTCEGKGNIAYYECSGCHKYFEDEDGTKEIEKNSVLIDAIGHDWSGWTFDGEEAKTHTRICANDSEHKQTEDCTFEKTTSGGKVTYTCSVCGGSYTSTLLSTDKSEYSMAGPIMVTATGTGKDWVGLYKKGDVPGSEATSYYYYYVNEHNNEPFNLLEGVFQHSLTPGEYTVYLLENDGYNVLSSVDITLTHTSSITTDKTAYSVGDPVMVTAASDYKTAWVGLYPYASNLNDDPDPMISKYDVKDSNGQAIDILGDIEDTLIGHYKVILFTDGYDIDDDGHLMIRSFWINDVYEGPVWTWNNSLTEATATFTAQHDSNVTETVEAVISSEVTKEATEEEDGIKTYTATIESVEFATVGTAPFTDTKTEVIPKLTHEHTCKLVPANDPTCEGNGNKAYYECSGCHKFFEDAEATKEIEDKDSVTLKALGHKWEYWKYDENTKTHVHKCENDPSHVENCIPEKTQSSDPEILTCKCKICGGEWEESTAPAISTDKDTYYVGEDIEVTTDIKGHTEGWVALYEKDSDNYSTLMTSMMWYYPHVNGYDKKVLQSIDGVTDRSNQNLGTFSWGEDKTLPVGEYVLVYLTGTEPGPYTRVGQPTYFSVVKDIESEETTKKPTCTEPGTKHIKYKDGTEEDVEIPALGHNPKEEWTYIAGEKKHYHACSRCDEKLDETTCTFDEGTVTKEPTAKEEGEMTYTCTVCGGTYTEAIPTLEDSGVKRIYGSTRYQTAILQANELKAVLKVDKFDAVIVATGENFADALSGAYLGYVKKAPMLLVNNSSVNEVKDYIQKNLASGGTIYLLGGPTVVPNDVTAGLSGFTPKRLYGKTRYETNIEILKEAGVKGEELMICDGNNFADSLSASAAQRPIFLVNKSLNKAQRAYLDTLRTRKYYLIGGTGVLPTALENDINTNFGSTIRLGGKDRYDTSVKVAKNKDLFNSPSKAVLAYGRNYPDGLCGGPLAAYMDAPLLLVQDASAATIKGYTSPKGIKSGIVLGGPSLIADKSARSIFGLNETDEIYVVNK